MARATRPGRTVGHAIILRDITESRRSTEKTIESERFNALTLLAAGVAHEIGNPLNSLHIHLQLMERKVRKLDGKVKTGASGSDRHFPGGNHPARFDRDAISPGHPSVEAAAASGKCEHARRRSASASSRRRSRIATSSSKQELRPDLPLIELDRDQMKQAFYNVIKNSFEAMKRRGILRIRTDLDATHVSISFTDTGGGMSAESLSRVFEPYFTTKSCGSGLGLLIVRRIVREHGGEMAIESNEGKGLTLTIRSSVSRQAGPNVGSRGS